MAFCNNPNYSVSFTHEGGRLDFGDGHSVSTTYAVFRPHDQEMVHETIDSKSATFVPRPPSNNTHTLDLQDDDVTTNTQEAIQEIKSNSPHTNTRRNKVDFSGKTRIYPS